MIELFGSIKGISSKIPFYDVSVSAGIPVPIETDTHTVIDLNEFLIEHPNSTFFARITGNELSPVGISDGDILIIDTSIEPTDGKLVLANLNDELTVKYFRDVEEGQFLESHDSFFTPLSLGNEIVWKIIGVITKVIHSI